MKRTLISRWGRVAVIGCLLAVLIPVRAIAMDAGSEGWLDQLTGFVVVQEGIARASSEPGSFDPYVGQVTLVRGLYDRGDWNGAYMAMNRLMDMLESREGGISAGRPMRSGITVMRSRRRRCMTSSAIRSGGTRPSTGSSSSGKSEAAASRGNDDGLFTGPVSHLAQG